MHIKDFHIAIDPSKTRAILTVETQDGSTIELVADLEQVKNIQKIVQYTAEHIAGATEISVPALIN
ncbi:MAG: hypothetical protein M0021_03210 [Clostridia bacterium]|nr:hypothetical protein [Clostridia bacterium]